MSGIKIPGFNLQANTRHSKARFEDIPLFQISAFKDGRAMTLPGIGIFIGYGYLNDRQLLMHEYGHILQAKNMDMPIFME